MSRRDRLNAFLRLNDAEAYELGTWDCAIFVFDAVAVQTGVDHIAAYRGRYTSHRQALRLMRKTDKVRKVVELADRKLGPPVPVAAARTGDVVSYDDSLGILYGEWGVFLAEEVGYVRIPRAKILRAWRAAE